MPARSLCQRFYKNILTPLHRYRQQALIDATSAVNAGASLTLTSIGRHLPGCACVKHKIKRIDRLLGNSHLHDEVTIVFQRVTRYITRNMSQVVILIDWSGYHSADFQLLRASLACDGRSLPLMNCVVPASQLGNPDIHERFINSLAECFVPETEVIVITDAGFRGRWYRQISDRGWIYISRVLGAHFYNISGEWEKVSEISSRASCTPVFMGAGLLERDKNARHEGNFYLYKSRPKDRKYRRPKNKAIHVNATEKARVAGKSPLLIFTNTTRFTAKQIMKLYSRRMQIEQNFRDEKNTRWGFGLRHGMSQSLERLGVLSLLATLASIVMWSSGYYFENHNIHMKYQANTVRHRRVMSLLTLAENVFRHSPHIFKTLQLEKSLLQLHRRYTDIVLVY